MNENEKQDDELSLVGHLTELRTRLIICILTLVLCMMLGLVVAKPVLNMLVLPVHALKQEPGRSDVLTFIVAPDGTLKLRNASEEAAKLSQISQRRFRIVWPADPARQLPEKRLDIGENPTQKLYYHSPLDPFFMLLKVSLMAGALLALPVLLWQAWLFIAPGLTKKERQVVKPLLVGAVFLFPLGAGFAYIVVRLVLQIMQKYTVENVDPLLNVSNYLSLLSTMMLIFGVIFEIPLILAIASRIGIVTPKFLQTYRRHAYVVLAVAAMILSPGTDPFTMVIVLVPLIALYELSIALAKPMALLHQRDAARRESEEENETESVDATDPDNPAYPGDLIQTNAEAQTGEMQIEATPEAAPEAVPESQAVLAPVAQEESASPAVSSSNADTQQEPGDTPNRGE